MKKWLQEYGSYLAWAIALASMVGSLYFSEVLGYAPCLLCWYQRIAMYPLVLILGISIFRRDRGAWVYALPLSIIGSAIALYQNLLVWHVLTERLAPCQIGVSCVTQKFVAFNFITIPLLSLVAFVLISILTFVNRADDSRT